MTITPTNDVQKVLVQVRNHEESDEYLVAIWPDVDSLFFEFMIQSRFRDDSRLEGALKYRAEGLPDGSKYSSVFFPVHDRTAIEAAIAATGKEDFEFGEAYEMIKEWLLASWLSEEIRKEIIFINERTEQPFKISE